MRPPALDPLTTESRPRRAVRPLRSYARSVMARRVSTDPSWRTPADGPDRSRPVRMVNVSTIRVTVWGENYHEHAERDRAAMAERYPEGMHGAIAAGSPRAARRRVEVRTATRDQPEHGLTEDVLDTTDVLTWWGHARHAEIDDAVVDRVHRRVLGGMGLLVLHSGHFAKIFTRLMGTTCSLAWRNSADTELVWTVAPAHPIARGVPHPIVIDEQEMYGEYFDIPAPDELVFLSTFSCGEVFRSGCCWRRGKGRVFYFSPGDQEYPVYHHPDIRRVLANAVQWARPDPEVGFDPPAVVATPAPMFRGQPGDGVSGRPFRAGGGRPRLGGPAAHVRVRRPARCRPGRAGRTRDRPLGGAGGAVRRCRRSSASSSWRDLLGLRRPRRAEHRHADHAARPDRGCRAGRRGTRAVGEAAGRERRGRRAHGRGGRAQPAACSTSRSTTAAEV